MTMTSTTPSAGTAHLTGPSRSLGAAKAALRITAVELRLFLREPAVLVGLVAFPAVTVLVLAGVFGSVPDPDFAGMSPSEHYVVGYIGVVPLPVHIASRRELGVVRRYRASGVSAPSLLASHAAVGTVLGVGAAAVVLLVGGAVYGLPAPVDPVAVLAWTAAGVCCFVALGIALGTLMPSSRAANAIGNLLFVPLFLLGGGGPPRAVMTGPMQTVSDLLPLSHVIGGLRGSWLGTTDDPRALWWTALVTCAAVVLAVRSSRRVR
jgi:ABC-2 type transport system permease protein